MYFTTFFERKAEPLLKKYAVVKVISFPFILNSHVSRLSFGWYVEKWYWYNDWDGMCYYAAWFIINFLYSYIIVRKSDVSLEHTQWVFMGLYSWAFLVFCFYGHLLWVCEITRYIRRCMYMDRHICSSLPDIFTCG